MTEQRWISELKAGNKEVFWEIYETYIDEIYAYVGRKVDQQGDVEDIVSQVFHKARLNILQAVSRENPNIRARIYKIAHHKVIDFYRLTPSLQYPSSIEDQFVSQSDSPDEHTQKQIITDTIMKHLMGLWEDIHEIFIMRFRQQLSYIEIAKINGKSVQNNKKIFSRACKNLRDTYPELSL